MKAVIRDAQRPVVIAAIEELGYIQDLKNELESVKRERDALKRQSFHRNHTQTSRSDSERYDLRLADFLQRVSLT